MTIYIFEYVPITCPICKTKLQHGLVGMSYCGFCINTYIGTNDSNLKILIRWMLRK